MEEVPAAIAPFQGRVLIGVGKLLRVYDLGKKKLLRKCENKVLPSVPDQSCQFGMSDTLQEEWNKGFSCYTSSSVSVYLVIRTVFALLGAFIQSSTGLDWAVVLPLYIPCTDHFLVTILTVLQVHFVPAQCRLLLTVCRGLYRLFLWPPDANVRGLTHIEDNCWECFVSLGHQQRGDRSWRVQLTTSSDLHNVEKGIFSLK